MTGWQITENGKTGTLRHDPGGYLLRGLIKGIKHLFRGITRIVTQIARRIRQHVRRVNRALKRIGRAVKKYWKVIAVVVIATAALSAIAAMGRKGIQPNSF